MEAVDRIPHGPMPYQYGGVPFVPYKRFCSTGVHKDTWFKNLMGIPGEHDIS